MKTQIHELRTRIDRLAQLVKSLDKSALLIINPSYPEMSQNELMEEFKKPGPIHYLPAESKIEQIGPGLSFLAESYKSLLLAKAWLGKVLAELGEETPYKNDGNRKTVEDIEPTSDSNYIPLTIDESVDWHNKLNYIEKIDWLREEIQRCIDVVLEAGKWDRPLEKSIQNLDVWRNLTEARFFLGFELSRIKEQSK